MRLRVLVLLAILWGVGVSSLSHAAIDVREEGYSANQIIHSRYFTIYIEEGADLEEVARKLAVPASIRAVIKNQPSFSNSLQFQDQLDTLFLAVSEIMDLRLKKFHSEIKICKDAASLSQVAMNLFGRPIQPRAFYVVALDTLYVDAESVTMNVLGHELSHAVQSHYFVVPPPEKIQEVLAGFVEYELRKYTGTLPK